jgi:dynein heavy chain
MELVERSFGADTAAQVVRRVIFVDFLREPTLDADTGDVLAPAQRAYEAVDLPALRALVEQRQRDFNAAAGARGIKQELVLFDAALEHLSRIARLMACDRGSALLVGVGGSGKQSLTRLAAQLAGAQPVQITITKQYNAAALFEDIKAMYKLAGFKGQKVAFIFTDAEVKDEAFLEYINQVLMTGAVAGLFPRDELDQIISDIRPIMKRESPELVDTYDNLYSFFMVRSCSRAPLPGCARKAHSRPDAGPRARQPARLPLLLAGGPQVLAPRVPVPGADQRLHRGLVPALAGGCAHRGV